MWALGMTGYDSPPVLRNLNSDCYGSRRGACARDVTGRRSSPQRETFIAFLSVGRTQSTDARLVAG